MNRLRQSRTAATIAVVITGLAVVYTLALLAGLPDPGWAHLPRGIIHLGELAAVVALALCGAAGGELLARIGLAAAGLGALLLAVAEVGTDGSPALSNTLFTIAPVLVGLGLVLTGIAVIRTGLWSSWRRYVPLVLGAYVFVVMTPVIAASGGPPAVASLWVLTGWEVLWVLIAVAVLTETAPAVRDSTAPVVEGRT
ncbi:hypothetical protein ACU61A_34670 [Pseudonocardia sichuanensis]